MREIQFRGKDKDTGDWVYGSLDTTLLADGLPTIAFYDNENFYCSPYVDPKTIGQFTGIENNDGVKIYERDIVELPSGFHYTSHLANAVLIEKGEVYVVVWDKKFCGWDLKTADKDYTFKSIAHGLFVKGDCKVVGNIYDNPKLLKEKKA